jgi:hypothetical protein
MVTVSLLKGFAWGFMIIGFAYSFAFLGKVSYFQMIGGFASSLFAWALISGFAIIVKNNLKGS